MQSKSRTHVREIRDVSHSRSRHDTVATPVVPSVVGVDSSDVVGAMVVPMVVAGGAVVEGCWAVSTVAFGAVSGEVGVTTWRVVSGTSVIWIASSSSPPSNTRPATAATSVAATASHGHGDRPARPPLSLIAAMRVPGCDLVAERGPCPIDVGRRLGLGPGGVAQISQLLIHRGPPRHRAGGEVSGAP